MYVTTHLFDVVMNQSYGLNDRCVVIFVLFTAALDQGCQHGANGCNQGYDDAGVHTSPQPASQDVADVPWLALQLPRPTKVGSHLAQELQT